MTNTGKEQPDVVRKLAEGMMIYALWFQSGESALGRKHKKFLAWGDFEKREAIRTLYQIAHEPKVKLPRDYLTGELK